MPGVSPSRATLARAGQRTVSTTPRPRAGSRRRFGGWTDVKVRRERKRCNTEGADIPGMKRASKAKRAAGVAPAHRQGKGGEEYSPPAPAGRSGGPQRPFLEMRLDGPKLLCAERTRATPNDLPVGVQAKAGTKEDLLRLQIASRFPMFSGYAAEHGGASRPRRATAMTGRLPGLGPRPSQFSARGLILANDNESRIRRNAPPYGISTIPNFSRRSGSPLSASRPRSASGRSTTSAAISSRISRA